MTITMKRGNLDGAVQREGHAMSGRTLSTSPGKPEATKKLAEKHGADSPSRSQSGEVGSQLDGRRPASRTTRQFISAVQATWSVAVHYDSLRRLYTYHLEGSTFSPVKGEDGQYLFWTLSGPDDSLGASAAPRRAQDTVEVFINVIL